MIYFDNAATTLIKPDTVYAAVLKAMKNMASPGRGGHKPAMAAAKELFECRLLAAELFNAAEPENIVFTMNATHGLNIAIKSLLKKGRRVLVSGFEHNSAVRPLYAAGAEVIVAGRELFRPEAIIRDFEKNIKKADFAVCTHVSNVFGYILPVYELAEICRENRVPLVLDASQSAGILKIDARKLEADYIAMPGHKGLFGPQGTGILICGRDTEPLMEGGSGSDSAAELMPDYMPDRLEAGTPNVCGIAGLRAGMEFIKRYGRENIYKHEKALLNLMLAELEGSGYELFSGENQCGVLSLRSPKLEPDSLARKLSESGICVRSGLHCAPLAHRSAGSFDTGTVRFSFSPFNSSLQLKYCCRLLKQII